MNKIQQEHRSVVIELAAAMLKAGVDYALEHQKELIEAFENLNGKKKRSRQGGSQGSRSARKV